jgi:hypothetical protein
MDVGLHKRIGMSYGDTYVGNALKITAFSADLSTFWQAFTVIMRFRKWNRDERK